MPHGDPSASDGSRHSAPPAAHSVPRPCRYHACGRTPHAQSRSARHAGAGWCRTGAAAGQLAGAERIRPCAGSRRRAAAAADRRAGVGLRDRPADRRGVRGIGTDQRGVACRRRHVAAVREGRITVIDATCPAMHTMLQAAEKGVPFMPLRGLIGSDILAHRPDWRVIDNPLADGGDPIVLLPALAPEFAAFHAAMADEAGNVWVGRRRELAQIAHAARRTLVTVERVVKGNMLADERLAPGVISGTYVEAIAVAERGAWPIALLDEYAEDAAHLSEYARLARTEEGFAAYLARFVQAP